MITDTRKQGRGRGTASPLRLVMGMLPFLMGGIAHAQWWPSGADIYNTNPGNVGIGTTTPAEKLSLGSGNVFLPNANYATDGNLYFGGGQGQVHMRLFGGLVNGSIPAGFIDVKTTDPNDGLRIRVDTAMGGTERMRITAGGNVGIGTLAPVWPLHVVGGTLSDGALLTRGYPPNDTTPNLDSQIGLNNRGAGGTEYAWRIFTAAVGGGYGVNPNSFEIWEYPPSQQPACCLQRLVILKAASGLAGPVVIDGAGNLSVAGNIAAKYQDVAEWVPARQLMEAGTVVVLDGERPNEVVASHEAYDTGVAGVVSVHPGLLLGEAGEGKVLVATTGRVKVKADARQGAIRVGDLLVTGGREGAAMKSEPIEVAGTRIHRPGTIIGKALEPLPGGEGEILVLLSLQ